jgi:hypothetical protein
MEVGMLGRHPLKCGRPEAKFLRGIGYMWRSSRVHERRIGMKAVKHTGLVLVVSLLTLGAAWLLPAHADTIFTITAETPPVVASFALSFTDSDNDGVYTPSDGDHFVPRSLVWSGGWHGFNGVLTELVYAPSNAYCPYTSDGGGGGKNWVFSGPGSDETFDTTIFPLTYTRTSSAVPCPPAAYLLGSGLIPLAWARRKKGWRR